MTRLIGIIIGLGFAFVVLLAFVFGASTVIGQGYLKEPSAERSFHLEPKDVHFASDGPLASSTERNCSVDSRCTRKCAARATRCAW